MYEISGLCSSGCLTYDAENRQVKEGMAGTQYVYDGAGKRVEKITNAGTLGYVYDALGQLAAQYNSNAKRHAGLPYVLLKRGSDRNAAHGHRPERQPDCPP